MSRAQSCLCRRGLSRPANCTQGHSDLSKTASEHIQERLQEIPEEGPLLRHNHDFSGHPGHELDIFVQAADLIAVDFDTGKKVGGACLLVS
jgi:hypothetical protein